MLTLKGHTSYVSSLAVLPDGKLVSGSHDGKIIAWEDGKCSLTLDEGQSSVVAIAALPDGTLASCSRDNIVRLWR
jgi:WD40 repeat protein